MATDLALINEAVKVTKFYGGDGRGVCAQVTADTGYVQLTAAEIVALLPSLKRVLDAELGRRKRECEAAIAEYKELMGSIVSDMHGVAEMAISQPVFDTAACLVLGQAAVTYLDGSHETL